MNNAVTRLCVWFSVALLTYGQQATAQTMEVVAGARDFLNLPGPTVATNQTSMVVGPDGNLFVLEYTGNLVRYRASDSTVATIPGSPLPPLDFNFSAAYTVLFDSAGVAYATSYEGLFQLDLLTGTKTLLGPFPNPGFGTAFGPGDVLYWTSAWDHRIRARLPSGEIRVIAGVDTAGFGGDGGPAEFATLNRPEGLAVAPNGDIYFSDQSNHRVRRISAATGIITTVFGTGSTTFTPDGLPAAQTNVSWPSGLVFDAAGNLLVVDSSRVRRIDAATSIVTTVAGSGSFTFSGDGGPATSAGMYPRRIAVDTSGNIYVQDVTAYRIRKVSAANGIITTVMGNGMYGYCGENVPARSACLGPVRGIDFDANGNLLLSDEYGHRVRRVSKDTGNIVTLMNPVPIPGDPAGATQYPVGVEHDPAGNIYVTTESHRVWKLDAAGAPNFFAGTGQQGFSGDGSLAGVARLNTPADIAFDSVGNAFIADTFNNRIRRVDAATRVITTYAGNGSNTGALGDGGPATSATVTFPQNVEVDPQGNLLIAETGGCIRRVDRVTRIITTLFSYGTQCVSTFPPGTTLLLRGIGYAQAMTFDRMGNLWFMYLGNLQRMNYATGVVTAPTAGLALRADGRWVYDASSLEFDSLGRLYIGDKAMMRVFRISGLANTVPDSTPPVITPQVAGQQSANGWYIGDVNVSFTVTDAESAIASQQGCAASSVTQDTDGMTLTCTATSTGGTATGTVTIRRDATPPTLEFGPAIPAANGNGWNGGDVSVSFVAADSLSGIASTSKSSPLAFTNEGIGMSQAVTVIDIAGNSATFASPVVNIDKTPPSVSADVSGTPGSNGWYVGTVQVAWSINEIPASTESTSGCEATSVALDTIGTTFMCTVTSAGGTTSRSTTVKVDASPPTLSFGAPSPAANAEGWNNSNVDVVFTADDATSGLASTSQASPLTFTNEGVGLTHSVTVTDRAGNSASFHSPALNIDKTPPMVAPAIAGTLGNNGWYRADALVEWSITEFPGSVISSSGCGTGSVTADTSGVGFTCSVTSGGGTTSNSVTIKRDATPPLLTFGTPSPAPNANGWNKTNVSIPFAGSDALSGVASTSVASPLVLSTEGAGVAGQITVTDNAGNAATVASVARNIDKTAPVVSIVSPASGAHYGFYQDVVADFACEDVSLLTCVGTVADGALVNTRSAGAKTFKVTGKDLVAFTRSVTNAFTVESAFNWGGFSAPANAPVINRVARNTRVPIRWQLPDGHGGFVTNTAAYRSIASSSWSCGANASVPYTETTTAPAGISFDAATSSFVYNWNTGSAAVCRTVTIELRDGSLHELDFKIQ